MPVVQKRKLDRDDLSLQEYSRQVEVVFTYEILVHRAKKKVRYQVHLWFARKKIRPFIWRMVRSPRRCERRPVIEDSLTYVQPLYKNQKKPCEVSSGVKYRPQNAHKDRLLQNRRRTRQSQITRNWSQADTARSRPVTLVWMRFKAEVTGCRAVLTPFIPKNNYGFSFQILNRAKCFD